MTSPPSPRCQLPKERGKDRAGLFWGCSRIRFCERSCTIFISYRVPNTQKRQEVLEHEEAHCRGYDHHGSALIRDGWARARARGCAQGKP